MKIYIVCEDYTCAFYGVFATIEEAEREAKRIGGFVNEFFVDTKNQSIAEVEE